MNNPLSLLWVRGHLAWPFFMLLVWLAVAILLWDIAWRLLTIPFKKLLFVALAVWGSITAGLLMAIGLRW